MGASYYQFCPVAKAMELLDERWTLLVVRELLSGSERFNDVRRGVPRMSPTLLSKRLHQLVRAGVVDKRVDGSEVRYVLTAAGEDLRPVVDALAVWGVRWVGELGDRDLDPKLLMWDIRRNIDRGSVPDGRTVVLFDFRDVSPRDRHWWLVLAPAGIDVCDVDPGYEVSVTVATDLRDMVRIWRGDVRWPDALRVGAVEVQGPEALRRALPGWFGASPIAALPRVESGGSGHDVRMSIASNS